MLTEIRWVWRLYKRLTCRHRDLSVKAATGAWPAPDGSSNLTLGVCIRCPRCGQTWARDVTVASGTGRAGEQMAVDAERIREAIAAPEAEPSSALMHNIVEQACITFNRMPGPAERRALDEPEVYDTAHPDPNQRLTPYKYESTADSVDITGTGRTEPEDRLTPRTPGARR